MRVKIDLKKGESKEDAEELLYKALKAKQKANYKHSSKFQNQGVQASFNYLNSLHKKMYSKLLKEIFEVLEK